MHFNKLKINKAYISHTDLNVRISKEQKVIYNLCIIKFIETLEKFDSLTSKQILYKFEIIKGDIEIGLRPQFILFDKKQVLLYVKDFK